MAGLSAPGHSQEAARCSPRHQALIRAAVNFTALLPVSLTATSHAIDGCLEDKKCAQKEMCTYLSVHCWLYYVQISPVSSVLLRCCSVMFHSELLLMIICNVSAGESIPK